MSNATAWLREQSPLVFVDYPDRYRTHTYLMSPTVPGGLQLLEERSRVLRRARLLDNWAVVPFLAMFVTGFAWAVTATGGVAVWPWVLGGLTVLAAVGFTVPQMLSKKAERTAARNLAQWKKDDHARRIDALEGFIVSTFDEKVIWEAIDLIWDSHDTARAVKWANSARPDGRLATGAHSAHDIAKEAAVQMRQQAADMLDPDGGFTSEWLLSKARA